MGDNNLSVDESTDTAEVESLLATVSDENPLKSVVGDLVEYIQRLEAKVEKNENKSRWLTNDIADIEKELSEVQSSEDKPQSLSTEDGSPESTPLEDIADENTENPPGVQVGPSVTRAAAIMSNWDKWSKQAPKGRTIRDGLKQLIETATGESLAWKQVYRACRKVEQLTKGKIVLTKTNRHGRILVQPDGRTSSASGG